MIVSLYLYGGVHSSACVLATLKFQLLSQYGWMILSALPMIPTFGCAKILELDGVTVSIVMTSYCLVLQVSCY